ncbi:unnamed protein product [Vitrella brassicaformis CCMP3155]|uniref:squalene monooxygenase n=1 Tax=Vitrella brassicaformis (strain CCMP3155) TaxID=1169540 RepID=A0A0G4GUA3_VITBC|nr:unnamed protein product [Vitrella brassicaformis CCMP3155]|eukprot:CEM34413.1 unnamed protein product [Vitrella brassicaformis CCMP3155]
MFALDEMAWMFAAVGFVVVTALAAARLMSSRRTSNTSGAAESARAVAQRRQRVCGSNAKGNSLEESHSDERYDVIIVGAGTAGAALATALGQSGRHVLLLDKSWGEQQRIVGEYMQPGGMRVLEKYRLDQCVKEDIGAVPSSGYAVILPASPRSSSDATAADTEDSTTDTCSQASDTSTSGGRETLLWYPSHDPAGIKEYFGFIPLNQKDTTSTATSNSAAARPDQQPQTDAAKVDTTGAPQGFCFHNGRFVQRLRETARHHSNVSVGHAQVTHLLEDKSAVIGVEYAPVDEHGKVSPAARRRALAPLTCMCDGGTAGPLRKAYTSGHRPQKVSTWVGLLLKHEPHSTPLPHPGCGHVVLTDPSPLLLYQISPTDTRALVCIDGDVTDYRRYAEETIAPQLPASVRPLFLRALREQRSDGEGNGEGVCRVEGMNSDGLATKNTYRYEARCPVKGGVVALGDALNMRHALTGCGMTVCLKDMDLLCQLLSHADLNDPQQLLRIQKNFYALRREHASTLNVLANALHAVFTTPEGPKKAVRRKLQAACFDYLDKGGACTAGPIGLLAGLTPKPEILAVHFTLVVFYAVKEALVQGIGRPLKLINIPSTLSHTYQLLHEGARILMPLVVREGATFLAWWPVRKLVQVVFPWEDMLM